MHPIVYDVAVSLDGFISGMSGDISKFAHDGPVVEDYTMRLHSYHTAIMGRQTYEFGYRFGLNAGENPYPQMNTVVFSNSLKDTNWTDVSVQPRPSVAQVKQLAKDATGKVYLCGGGEFAGWMLEHGLIDKIILKRAPCILGGGVRLFGTKGGMAKFTRINTRSYENGYLLEEYAAC